MIRSMIQNTIEANQIKRTMLAVGAMLAVAAFSLPIPATAQTGSTVTFTNPNCTGYALTGTPPNQTLTCITGGSGIPTGCTITGPTTGTWGAAISLTSNCSGGGVPTSWAWTGGTCAGVTTQSCSAIESVATSRTYTVTASNGSGAGNLATTTVTWSQGGSAGVPSGCTLTPATQTVTFPAVLGLTAQCSGGTLPITHSFTGAIVGTWQQTSYSTGIFIQNNYTQATSVSVATSNSAGIGPTSTASISGAGGGGGGGLANCAAQGLTVMPAGGATATWGQAFSTPSTSAGNFGPGDQVAWVYKLTVPAGTGFTSFGRFVISEYAELPTPRQISISTQACDFRPRDITGASGPLALCSDGQTCEVYYGVTGPSSAAAGLTAGTTYYISARNWQSPGQSSCGNQHCNAIMAHDPAR